MSEASEVPAQVITDAEGLPPTALVAPEPSAKEGPVLENAEGRKDVDLLIVFGQGPVKPILLREDLDSEMAKRWDAFKTDPLHNIEPDFRVLESKWFLDQIEGLDEEGIQQKMIEWQKLGRFGLIRWGRQNALAAGFALISGYTNKLLLTGGKTIPPWAKEKLPPERIQNWPSEAQLLADIIRRRFGSAYEKLYGEPIDSAISLEDRSTNTIENIAYSTNVHPELIEGENVGLLTADFHTSRVGRIAYLFSPDEKPKKEYSAQQVLKKRAGEKRLNYQEIIDWMLDPTSQELQTKFFERKVWSQALQDPELLTYWLGYVGIVENPKVMQKVIQRLGTSEDFRKSAIEAFRLVGLDFEALSQTDLMKMDPQEFRAVADKLRILSTKEYRKFPNVVPPQTLVPA